MLNFLKKNISDSPVSRQDKLTNSMENSTGISEIGAEIISIIHSSPDPQLILSKVAQSLGNVFPADTCLIIAGTDPSATLQLGLWGFDISELPPGVEGNLLSHPLVTAVLNREDPLAIADLGVVSDISTASSPWQSLAIGGVLGVATKFQFQVNGAIIMANLEPCEWSETQQNWLQGVAQYVALAISQAQLQYQATFSSEYQALLRDLSGTLRNASEPEEILTIALARTANILKVDCGLLLMLKYADPISKSEAKAKVIYRWSADTNTIEAPTGSSSIANYSFWVSDCVLCQTALEKAPQSLAISSPEDIAALQQPEPPACFFDLEAMPALIIVPLMGRASSASQGLVLGFFVLQHRQAKLWQPEQINLVKWVSSQASTTMIHNQTLCQVQSLVEERTVQLKKSLEVQAMLYDKTRQQVNQLRCLNQLKDDIVTNLSHELKTPLASMKLAVKMLHRPELSPEQKAKYLDILDQEWNREHRLIQDFLTLQDVESNKFVIHPQEFTLQPVIAEMTREFQEKWQQGKGLQLVVNYSQALLQQPLTMYTDVASLKRILQELLLNAAKFAPRDTSISLDVGKAVSTKGDEAIITITNVCSGISPEEKEEIFEPFRRGQGATDRAIPGTGLGLALVKCLVQHLNGKIELSSRLACDSSLGQASFTVTLPQLKRHSLEIAQ